MGSVVYIVGSDVVGDVVVDNVGFNGVRDSIRNREGR